MARVDRAARAQADLIEIWNHIAEDGPSASSPFHSGAGTALDRGTELGKMTKVSLDRIIRAQPRQYALRAALRRMPRATFDQAYRQATNALKARPQESESSTTMSASSSSSKDGLKVAVR